ncbi:uncharacterized protein H6S33_008600 [Morchella sextelata]|uniref:uncharacterized protein n=1 Tax=Morchella sextelata TaxID=1174677 RepID=UPI001D04F841|nr:uncharacterized protein H6S33_008600 [Morchella sextelata]KAH0602519.1 hypothetical protein H6S33_008600 [Morchella sextelata]
MVHYIAALVSSKEVNLPDDMITLAELSALPVAVVPVVWFQLDEDSSCGGEGYEEASDDCQGAQFVFKMLLKGIH